MSMAEGKMPPVQVAASDNHHSTQSARVRMTTGIQCKLINSACVKACQEIVCR